ncbi:MAG: Rieske 2Fe-2S domain-containing protein [Myxococcales bacterium]|nr:Rieske 2Fe-2S domain-containing protein [Deltaproteobacteria bacterium]MBW2191092.1 Rieske 2Fe-2S domain-containing protein [Deltaproteobacteria bacterium]NOQ82812.1 Rieske 2Fe-2S domain-containing protein [Myxococcales bacterium]
MAGGVQAPLRALPGRLGARGLDPIVESAREATYPPPYPECWYVVGRSVDFHDRPTFVQCAGNQWVVFRDASGQARVVDAYCPHMGANLADGTVRGDCVECPFHGWRIRGDGCVESQSGECQPNPRHRTRSWAVQELHGWVLVYHRHENVDEGPAPEPPYHIERVAEIDEGGLVWRGEHDAGLIQMHILEFIENTVDFQHFAAIHGRLRVPWTEIPVPGMRIHHEATWHRDETEKHVCWFNNDAILEFRGKPIPGSGAQAKVRLEGPGSVVRFEFTVARGGGRVVMYQSHTPVAPLSQHVRFRWFSDPSVPKPVASFIVGNWVSQWRQDHAIWQRKIYRRNPLLTRGDGPIHQLRRWYGQFYPTRASASPQAAE